MLKPIIHDARLFWDFFFFYVKKKSTRAILWFEKHKNILVKFLLMKRGRYNRPFLHIATMGVLFLGVLIGPFIADTYPLLAGKASAQLPSPSSQHETIDADKDVFKTERSEKLRDDIID